MELIEVLVVPVLRETDEMSFADIEKNISNLGQKAKNGKLLLRRSSGGHIYNYQWGNLLINVISTPILNPPQSAVLGMHNIVQRPVVLMEM